MSDTNVASRLCQVVGGFETGLFLGLCALLIVGHLDGVEQRENPATPVE